MCVNCVAGSLPYVGLAIGGLRVMGARARAGRAVAVGEPAEQDEAVEERPQATPT